MSVSGLKAELKFLESIFDPNHERFRILDWKPDELSCQFNVTGDQLLIIHCNITVRAEPNTPGPRRGLGLDNWTGLVSISADPCVCVDPCV